MDFIQRQMILMASPAHVVMIANITDGEGPAGNLSNDAFGREDNVFSINTRKRLTVCVFPRRIPDNASIDIIASACEREGIRYIEYDWLLSNFRKFDVFHVHWPDATLMGANRIRAVVKTTLFLLSVFILSLRRKPIIYSVHNIGSNDGNFRRLETLLWRVFLHRVSVFQHFNRDSVKQMIARYPGLASDTHRVIPHPNYRSQPGGNLERKVARSKLGFAHSKTVLLNFGRLRPYKGVEDLIGAFRRDPDVDALLVIAGLPSDAAYAEFLKSLCVGDPRIRLIDRYIPQEELNELICACDVVVLAHRKINNSGVALLGLSRNRAILAPARGSILDLAEDPGGLWVTLFDGAIDQTAISTAIARARRIPEGTSPDLSSSDAEAVGVQFMCLYFETATTQRSRQS